MPWIIAIYFLDARHWCYFKTKENKICLENFIKGVQQNKLFSPLHYV
jgi:hypothetical protein